jgi:hypothetical protein
MTAAYYIGRIAGNSGLFQRLPTENKLHRRWYAINRSRRRWFYHRHTRCNLLISLSVKPTQPQESGHLLNLMARGMLEQALTGST